LGVVSYLHYPIAHHRFAEQILTEEAARVPRYAATLQFHDLPASLRARFEAELLMADRIFVLSSFQKRTFIEAGVDEEKLVLTPLGVDLKLFRPGPRRRNEEPFRVIFVGQITQRKGISYLFDAFDRASIPNSELLLVGRVCGTDRPWSRLPRVKHIPHVPRWKLPEIYSQADVFVLPSLVEGFPHTALEAMACGLPVIVSENTFGTDVVEDGENGYVVPIRDPDAIADRLRHLHANGDERSRMGAAARRRAAALSWDNYGGRVATIIGETASKLQRIDVPR
jgi:glycosyltransferase involved in cell wall biosynthesis